MVIQHNLPAMNSHRQMGINNSQTSRNLEKLSSGFRINKASDDAAGLAISEKMRGQIRGLDMAGTNAANGVSLIQTAEGGLNETHSILQRMRELAVQSANGTYHDEVDRENINKEVQALKSEIDRISSSTHYNGINLLDGSLGAKGVQDQGYTQLDTDLANLGLGTSANTFSLNTVNGADFAGQAAKLIVNGQEGGETSIALQIGDKSYKLDASNNKDFYYKDDNGATVVVASLGTAFTAVSVNNSGVVVIKEAMLSKDDGTADTGSSIGATSGNRVANNASELVFQIGANGGADQRVGLHVDNMSSSFLGTNKKYNDPAPSSLDGNKVIDVDASTREKANDSINILNDAINQVSGTRADLGALQNRLEHTINNLGVTRENLQAAESSIRDVDMAKEMMEFTKNNILIQASQSMLAQSNQLPQGVLQLLR